MSNFYFVGTGAWNSINSWSSSDGGTGGYGVPTLSDDCFFTALSGSGTCTVTGTGDVCNSINFTGFTGTLTISSPTDYLTVYGDITLPDQFSATINGSGKLRSVGSSNLTSNYASSGNQLNVIFEITGGGTPTFVDDWYLSTLNMGGAPYNVLGSQTIIITSALTGAGGNSGINNGSGASNQIVLGGSGAASSMSWDNVTIGLSMDIQIPSGTTLTIGTVGYHTGTLSCSILGGSISCTDTLTVTSGSIDTGGKMNHGNSWNTVSTDNSALTITLLSDLYILGNLSVGGTTPTHTITINGLYNIHVTGNLIAGTQGGSKGTATIYLQDPILGTWAGNWSAGGTPGVIQNNMNVYSVNSHSILGSTVYYTEGLLTMFE
jgi:hypothetical protein